MKQINKLTLFLLLVALVFASAFATAMVVMRSVISGTPWYFFLVWNLVLAWLPLAFALAALIFARQWWWVVLWLPLWLLFFPNAPYIMTDLIHLRPYPDIPLWYDAIMVFAFALTGLLLGHLSLYLMHEQVTHHFGKGLGWVFVLSSLGLGGLGVYIGRFLRWNSWDIFFAPSTIWYDVVATLTQPDLLLRTVVISGLLTAVTLVMYIVLFSLPRLRLAENPMIR